MTKVEPLEVRVYRHLDDLLGVLPAWEALLTAYPLATTFSTWEWLSAWWRAFGASRQMLVLGFFGRNTELVGLAPLYIENKRVLPGLTLRSVSFMGDGSGDSDNLDMPMRPGIEERCIRTLLEYLRTQAPAWDICAFNLMNPESPGAKCLMHHLQNANWPVFTSTRPWSVVSLPVTWEDYLGNFSGKERGLLGNLTRRLHKRYRVRFYKCTDEIDLPGCLETLFELHEKRWRSVGEAGTFVSAERRCFYGDIGSSFLTRRWLEFWFLEVDGKTVATNFSFRYRDTVYTLQGGFDPVFASDSVGYVLTGHILKQLINEGVRRYDFLGGWDFSKKRWLAQIRHYISLQFARPFTVGSVYLHGINNTKNSKEWLRKHLPKPAWSVLHDFNVRLRGKARRKTQQRTR